MMLFLAILAVVLGVVGIIGSIIPGIPGPPVSWLGMLAAYFVRGLDHDGNPMSLTMLLVSLAVVTVVSIIDYVVPMKFTRLTGGTRAGSRGAMIGLVIGLLVPPVGMIVGCLLGAFLGELLAADKGFTASLKSALGAFAGFICGTGLKLVTSAVLLYYIVVYAF